MHVSKCLKACVTKPDLNNAEAQEYVKGACQRLDRLYTELRKAPSRRDPPEFDVGQAVLPSVSLLKNINRYWKTVEQDLQARNSPATITALDDVSREAFDVGVLRAQSATAAEESMRLEMNPSDDTLATGDSGSFDDESSNTRESASRYSTHPYYVFPPP
ncbi:MAG: hypothetical protein H0V43_01830, partial [Gemmatimonadales bacterium]|nr:hypothetical protein [Gemmatimonadales bacterium]